MSLTKRADTIAEDLQDLAADVQDNDEAVTQIDTIIEALRAVDFAEENEEEDADEE